MTKATEIIQELANTGSRNDKLAILQAYADESEFKEIMQFIYNPYVRTGISKAKLSRAINMNLQSSEISTMEAIKYFKEHTTGSDADLAFVSAYINQFEDGTPDRWIAEAIITQDLKIGVTSTSLNAVYGREFIPKTGCMLGTLFDDVGSNRVQWPCIVTEKLDGIRRVMIKENGIVRCYSRSGHEDTGMVEIINEAKFLPDNYVYDGELIAAGNFKDNIATRQATSSIANSGGMKKNLIFNVFDMIPIAQFYWGVSTENAAQRKIRLAATLDDQDSVFMMDPDNWQARIVNQRCSEDINIDMPHIKAVPILGVVKNFEEVAPIVERIWARQGEGVMLNVATGKYEIKRSKQLLKVKFVKEMTLPVVGFIEGQGKYEDMLGAIIVEYRGSKVGVGSGFTEAQRFEIWNNQEYYKGKLAEIDTFGESQNQAGMISLNCPIFKGWAQLNKDAAPGAANSASVPVLRSAT